MTIAMNTGLRTLLWGCLLLTGVTACSTTPPWSSSDIESGDLADDGLSPFITLPEPDEPAPPQRYGNFTREQLTTAIISELGGQRGNVEQAAQRYRELALETRDTSIIARAAEFAAAAGHGADTIELARLWIEREPDNGAPHLMLGYQLLENGETERGLDALERALALGESVDFTALSSQRSELRNEQRAHSASTLRRLREQYPDNASLHYALAQMLDHGGEAQQARAVLDEARERFGPSARLHILDAQLLQNLGQHQAALETLSEGVQQYPRHRLLRYNYARILVQSGQLRRARTQFNALLQLAPGDLETVYSLALLNLELQDPGEAREQFRTLLEAGHRRNESRYYMGYLEAREGTPDQAVYWYQQVERRSAAYLTAQREIMRLLVQQERFDEARQWAREASRESEEMDALFASLEAEALLNADHEQRASALLDEALERHPDHVELLFTRALLNEERGDIGAVEQDLRHIIELEPDDARALNHLGYTLTIHTDRYEEALELIERALAIEPDDPAIIDSLGWVQFKLGRHGEALQNLTRAYAAYPNDEVAAHLGEVLWVSGREGEAMEIWREALERDPDSDHLHEVMERLAS